MTPPAGTDAGRVEDVVLIIADAGLHSTDDETRLSFNEVTTGGDDDDDISSGEDAEDKVLGSDKLDLVEDVSSFEPSKEDEGKPGTRENGSTVPLVDFLLVGYQASL